VIDCMRLRLGSRHQDVAAGDCQFGWSRGVRNLLRQNSFWLQRPDLNRRRWTSETRLLTSQVLSVWTTVPGHFSADRDASETMFQLCKNEDGRTYDNT
jgi:hypothetical protein